MLRRLRAFKRWWEGWDGPPWYVFDVYHILEKRRPLNYLEEGHGVSWEYLLPLRRHLEVYKPLESEGLSKAMGVVQNSWCSVLVVDSKKFDINSNHIGASVWNRRYLFVLSSNMYKTFFSSDEFSRMSDTRCWKVPEVLKEVARTNNVLLYSGFTAVRLDGFSVFENYKRKLDRG